MFVFDDDEINSDSSSDWDRRKHLSNSTTSEMDVDGNSISSFESDTSICPSNASTLTEGEIYTAKLLGFKFSNAYEDDVYDSEEKEIGPTVAVCLRSLPFRACTAPKGSRHLYLSIFTKGEQSVSGISQLNHYVKYYLTVKMKISQFHIKIEDLNELQPKRPPSYKKTIFLNKTFTISPKMVDDHQLHRLLDCSGVPNDNDECDDYRVFTELELTSFPADLIATPDPYWLSGCDIEIPGFTNIIFLIQEENIYCNKEFMSLLSPVFYEMISKLDPVPEGDIPMLELDDVSLRDFMELLDVVYPVHNEINDENVEMVMKLAHRFKISFLLQKCERFLVNSFTMNSSTIDFAKLFYLADRFELRHLLNRCLFSLNTNRNVSSIVQSKYFENISAKGKYKLLEGYYGIVKRSSSG